MVKIRESYYINRKKMNGMISFVDNGLSINYMHNIMFYPLLLLHNKLPLALKFLPEIYVIESDNDIKGIIVVSPRSFNKKIEIEKLYSKEELHSYMPDLINFVVPKYKTMGALSVLIKVDICLSELVEMLVAKCNFTQISSEKLWYVGSFNNVEYDKYMFRRFENSDAHDVAEIYNESLLPHFRPLLSKQTDDFCEKVFKGLINYDEYQYIIEAKDSNVIIAYISIKTYDEVNYVIDFVQTNVVEFDIKEIISFAVNQIRKRNKNFELYIKSKRYMYCGEKNEKLYADAGFKVVKDSFVLTNSSAKILKNTVKSHRYLAIGSFYPSGAVQI